MWAGRCLRVILNAKGRNFFAAKSFKGLVVKIDVCQLSIFIFERINIYTETVVLAGYFYFACLKVFDRVVSTVMAEFKFVSFASESQTKQLMAEADSEDRHSAEHFANLVYCIVNTAGVSRAVT